MTLQVLAQSFSAAAQAVLQPIHGLLSPVGSEILWWGTLEGIAITVSVKVVVTGKLTLPVLYILQGVLHQHGPAHGWQVHVARSCT